MEELAGEITHQIERSVVVLEAIEKCCAKVHIDLDQAREATQVYARRQGRVWQAGLS